MKLKEEFKQIKQEVEDFTATEPNPSKSYKDLYLSTLISIDRTLKLIEKKL